MQGQAGCRWCGVLGCSHDDGLLAVLPVPFCRWLSRPGRAHLRPHPPPVQENCEGAALPAVAALVLGRQQCKCDNNARVLTTLTASELSCHSCILPHPAVSSPGHPGVHVCRGCGGQWRLLADVRGGGRAGSVGMAAARLQRRAMQQFAVVFCSRHLPSCCSGYQRGGLGGLGGRSCLGDSRITATLGACLPLPPLP